MSIFTHVRERAPQRSKKDLSHNTIFDTGFGRLVPTLCRELTANDYAVCATSSYIQPTSLFAPAFTKIKVRQRHFIVPYRLLYGNKYLEDFLSDNEGAVYEPYTTLADLAKITITDKWTGTAVIFALQHGQLADFFNIETLPYPGSTTGFSADDIYQSINNTDLGSKKISLIKAMAYIKIWNDWYRDENYQNDYEGIIEAIQNLPTFPYVSVGDTWDPDWSDTSRNILTDLFTYQFANVGKDYFMGALPFQQAGNPVRIPLGDTAPIFGQYHDTVTQGLKSIEAAINDNTDFTVGNATSSHSNKFDFVGATASTNTTTARFGLDLYADLADAAGIDIVEFRTLQAAQRWYEKNARGGRRLVEILRSRFFAKVPDIFMERSVYVGGTVEDVKIDTVFATNNNGEGQLLGDYAGRAYAAGKSKYYGFHTVEPAMFMTIQTILPVPQYFHGISKDNCRLTVFDKVNPEFARIGEQPVMSDEFFVDYENAANYNKDAIFGYVPRYADYMVAQDEIHGQFRDTLKFWHTGLDIEQNQTYPNMELSSQLLTQDYYKDANRIFTLNPVAEFAANPFRCVTYFEFKNKTCLPVNPASII